MTETYNFSSGLKKIAFGSIGLGLFMIILGALFANLGGGHEADAHGEGHAVEATADAHGNDHGHETTTHEAAAHADTEHGESHGHEGNGAADRIWASLLICAYYFVGIGLGITFLMAAHQIGYGGWQTIIKRIPEAMGSFVPVGGVLLLVATIGGAFHVNHLYHWAADGIMDPNSPNFDPIIKGKEAFLNPVFYSFRMVAYVGLWSAIIYMIKNNSRKEDEIGVKQTYQRSKYIAAFFILVFAVTSSTGSWDIIMSVDTHWYSTLFGWYNLSSYVTGGIAATILIVVYLQSQGYLKMVNKEHYHNLGIFLFGFSVFWTYLWFSQFMLIWYGNIPEATTYYAARFDVPFFKFLFFTTLIVNFVFPFFILMTRNAKRNVEALVLSAVVIFIGHWLDIYLMVTPGAVGAEHASLGLIEFGMLFAFIGLFIFTVFTSLTKASLIPVNNPYLKESLQHHTIK